MWRRNCHHNVTVDVGETEIAALERRTTNNRQESETQGERAFYTGASLPLGKLYEQAPYAEMQCEGGKTRMSGKLVLIVRVGFLMAVVN